MAHTVVKRFAIITAMDLIADGLKQGLIRFEDSGKYIVYLPQGKRRNYENPEEKVQAEAFLRLALIYRYPAKRIRNYVSVQMGSEVKEADIIVYDDDALKSPLIVAECMGIAFATESTATRTATKDLNHSAGVTNTLQ